jgi:hypothetical protein
MTRARGAKRGVVVFIRGVDNGSSDKKVLVDYGAQPGCVSAWFSPRDLSLMPAPEPETDSDADAGPAELPEESIEDVHALIATYKSKVANLQGRIERMQSSIKRKREELSTLCEKKL